MLFRLGHAKNGRRRSAVLTLLGKDTHKMKQTGPSTECPSDEVRKEEGGEERSTR